jgi:RecJ-like exonuclease
MNRQRETPQGGPTEQASAAVVPQGEAAGDQTPAGQRTAQMHQGDELPAGAPGAGENVCRICNGSGKTASGETCPYCGGTGKVTESVAGGP